jgi:CubicO group peptidase (beta-lactamase class C family)
MKSILTFLFGVLVINIYAQTLYFPPITGNQWDTLSPSALNWCQPQIDSLYSYLDANNTKAFILLKDGKIVLEKYFGTHTQSSVWQWASAGKTITSFMVGIAQQEGFLSINDSTSKWLGNGWTACTPQQEKNIKVWNQLTMTSGLDDNVADPFCTIDTCLIYKADAGTRWAYHNAPYTLLDKVIENSTGFTLNQYTTQKLKNPTGMTGLFVPVDFNNVYFSNARSMARFGLLMLNKGKWNSTQILNDTSYFSQLINTSQNLNKSYGYLWWLNGKQSFMVPGSQLVIPGPLNPNAPSDLYIAMGKDGQFLNVVPSNKMVWVRMGNAPDGLPVPYLLNDEIWKRINLLNCSGSGMSNELNENLFSVYPNPTGHLLNLISNEIMTQFQIYTLEGRLKLTGLINNKSSTLDVSELNPGVYTLKVSATKGDVIIRKFVKY